MLEHLYYISKVYNELEQAEINDKSLTPIVDAMKQKFLKYWEDVPLLAVIANCLNPAYKKYYTIKFIERYKEYLHLDSTGVETYVDSKFDEMFHIYSSRMSGNQNPSSSQAGPRYKFKYTCIFNIYYLQYLHYLSANFYFYFLIVSLLGALAVVDC